MEGSPSEARGTGASVAGTQRQGPVRAAVRWIGAIASATAAMWVVAAIALWIYAGPDQPPKTHTLPIPAGTAASVANGGNPLELPANWSLRAGDRLVIENDDVATHVIGPWSVRGGERQTLVLSPDLGELFCTLHPGKVLHVEVALTRGSWEASAKAALLFGPALGLVALAVARVARSLDEPAAPDGPPSPPEGLVVSA